jgi:hypothetical protein
MEVASSPVSPIVDDARPAWELRWLTPRRCRIIFVALLAFGFISHIRFLTNNCPLDLSGDEAQYWDWSRNLDLSYYSKGPLVAYIIRASCAVFGDTMFGVRFPALVFAVGTSILTYWLARKLFASDRIALGTVLLTHLVPMFVAGSVLMTIDPPFYFCWAATTCLAVKAIWDERRWAWPAMGVVLGVGFLAKYAMFLWLVGFAIFLITDPSLRRHLRSPWPWMMLIVALVCTTPVVVWNVRHHWASFHHVAHQTGAEGGAFSWANPIEFLAGQIFVVGPPLVAMMLAASRWGLRSRRNEHRRETRFLAIIGLSFFAIVFATSFFAKVQVNWPAPAYFTLMILTAYYLSTRLRTREKWKPWRGWFYGTVIFGLLIMPIAHDMTLIYPLVPKINSGLQVIHRALHRNKKIGFCAWLDTKGGAWAIDVRNVDPTVKLRGWKELGQSVSNQLTTLGPEAFILCEDYQQVAETAFYADGQPRTYYAGSYFAKRHERKRFSQYDMWPDRALDQPGLRDRNAIYVGYITRDVENAFASVEELPRLDIMRDGLKIRSFRVFRCLRFKGMNRPGGRATF